jgi:hypothetical protein
LSIKFRSFPSSRPKQNHPASALPDNIHLLYPRCHPIAQSHFGEFVKKMAMRRRRAAGRVPRKRQIPQIAKDLEDSWMTPAAASGRRRLALAESSLPRFHQGKERGRHSGNLTNEWRGYLFLWRWSFSCFFRLCLAIFFLRFFLMEPMVFSPCWVFELTSI